MTIILLACGPCVVIVNCWDMLCTLGRAPRTKETLPDFREWCRVTRHPRVFRRLTSCQQTPGKWDVTYGSDYYNTFSPVAKIASVRLLLFMVAMQYWPLYQLDIKNAFLHSDLTLEVYMEQPPEFVATGEFRLVCRLRHSLYGLKQFPQAWFSLFSSVVQKFGMTRSTTNHLVFYHHISSE